MCTQEYKYEYKGLNTSTSAKSRVRVLDFQIWWVRVQSHACKYRKMYSRTNVSTITGASTTSLPSHTIWYSILRILTVLVYQWPLSVHPDVLRRPAFSHSAAKELPRKKWLHREREWLATIWVISLVLKSRQQLINEQTCMQIGQLWCFGNLRIYYNSPRKLYLVRCILNWKCSHLSFVLMDVIHLFIHSSLDNCNGTKQIYRMYTVLYSCIPLSL